MFDANKFKRSVKDWMRDNPDGSESDLLDYCEELIPQNFFASHRWLIDHTMSWYRHVQTQRQARLDLGGDESESEIA